MSEIENWYDPAKQPMHGAWNPDHPLHKEWKFAADLLQQLNETRASLTRQTERVEELEAFARYAAERFAQIECVTLTMMITSPQELSDYRVALASEGARRARSALDEGRAPSGEASHKSRQEGEDDGG